MVTVVVPMVHYGHSAPRSIYILKWHSLIPLKINILVLTPWQLASPNGSLPSTVRTAFVFQMYQ